MVHIISHSSQLLLLLYLHHRFLIMKFLRQITSRVFHACLLLGPALVDGAPILAYYTTPVSSPPAVPIGFSGGLKASVDGRLFRIDGKTQYFAGKY